MSLLLLQLLVLRADAISYCQPASMPLGLRSLY